LVALRRPREVEARLVVHYAATASPRNDFPPNGRQKWHGNARKKRRVYGIFVLRREVEQGQHPWVEECTGSESEGLGGVEKDLDGRLAR
jgi:hypothetical protein